MPLRRCGLHWNVLIASRMSALCLTLESWFSKHQLTYLRFTRATAELINSRLNKLANLPNVTEYTMSCGCQNVTDVNQKHRGVKTCSSHISSFLQRRIFGK